MTDLSQLPSPQFLNQRYASSNLSMNDSKKFSQSALFSGIDSGTNKSQVTLRRNTEQSGGPPETL